MFVPVRLVLRRLQLEFLVFLGASLGLAAITVDLTREIAQTKGTEALLPWLELVAYARAALVCLPVLAGLVVGTSLVAGEIDRGTSVFAWSVALDRRHWLAEIVAAGLLLVLVIAIPVAVAGEMLSSALGTQLDATWSPAGIDPSALLLLVRPIAALAIAAVVGAVVGRSLPTLLIGLVASCLVLGALELGFAAGRGTQAIPIDPSSPGVFWVADRIVALDGRVVSDQEARAAADKLGDRFYAQYRKVPFGLTPADRERTLTGEVVAVTATAGIALFFAGVLVERRRPA